MAILLLLYGLVHGKVLNSICLTTFSPLNYCRNPKILRASPLPDVIPGMPSNLSAEMWPERFQKLFAELEQELKEGEEFLCLFLFSKLLKETKSATMNTFRNFLFCF